MLCVNESQNSKNSLFFCDEICGGEVISMWREKEEGGASRTTIKL